MGSRQRAPPRRCRSSRSTGRRSPRRWPPPTVAAPDDSRSTRHLAVRVSVLRMYRPLAGVVICAALACAGCGGDTRSRTSAAQQGTWEALAPATLARTEVAAARVGRFVYVMGGFEQQTGDTTRATERYDIVRDTWKRVGDMPVGLNHAAAASYRGDVYLLGGYRARSSLDQETAALYRYDPQADRWSRQPPAPTARGALAVGVIGHRLYAVGGANTRDGALTTLEIYDLRRRRW